MAASAAARQSAADARAGSNAASNAEIRACDITGSSFGPGADAPLAVRPKNCGARRKRRQSTARPPSTQPSEKQTDDLASACFGAHTGRTSLSEER